MEEFYKKKVIRDFLSLFSESKWKSLCIWLLEYGIWQLKKSYQISSLSIDDIDGMVDEWIEEDKRNQKKRIKQFEQATPKQTACNVSANKSKHNGNSLSSARLNTVSNCRPSTEWRKGETKTIFDGNGNDSNYYQQNQNWPNNSWNTNNHIMNNSPSISDISAISKVTKVKMIDDVLFPKEKKIVSYTKEHKMFGNSTNNRKAAYRSHCRSNSNKNRGGIGKQPDHKPRLVGSNSNSQMKFTSGWQMLKMRKDDDENDTCYTCNNYNTNTNNYDNKMGGERYHKVESKIKKQVEADKKIYEMWRNQNTQCRGGNTSNMNNYNNNNTNFKKKKTFEEKESSITYRKSEMSFEDDFSSLV